MLMASTIFVGAIALFMVAGLRKRTSCTLWAFVLIPQIFPQFPRGINQAEQQDYEDKNLLYHTLDEKTSYLIESG